MILKRAQIFFLVFALSNLFGVNASSEVDLTDFLALGCKRMERAGRKILNCSEAGIEKKYNCLELREVPAFFSALIPQVPIVQCRLLIDSPSESESEAVLYEGCGMLPVYSKYLIVKDRTVIELKNRAAFENSFSPIENPDEALSFAAALTGFTPKYEVEIPPHFIKMTKQITPTYAKSVNGIYQVRLFGYHCGGCDLHPYFFVDYRITPDGMIEETGRENVYRDPKEDNVCQD